MAIILALTDNDTVCLMVILITDQMRRTINKVKGGMQCERPIPREETYECSRVGPVSGDVSLDGEGQGQERRVSIQAEKAWTVPEIRYSGSRSIHQQSACGMIGEGGGE